LRLKKIAKDMQGYLSGTCRRPSRSNVDISWYTWK